MKGLVADLRFTKTFACDKPHYPYELPKGWAITDIGELLINRDGERKPVSSAIRCKQKDKVYDYYGAAGVIDKVDEYLFDERLLLIGEDGANLLSRSKDNAFFADGKYWVNNHAHVLDATDKSILDFVAIVINSMKLDDFITGSAQPKLSQDNLNKIPVMLPPINEQCRILKEVKLWFSLIALIERGKDNLIETIKQAKSKILDLAIHGKLVPQDPNDEPASELLKRINPKAEITCDNHQYGKLPKGWCLCHIPDVANTLLGKTLDRSKNTGTPKDYLCAINVLWGKFDFTTHKQFLLEKNEYERYAVMKGDLMVCEGGDVGRCAIWEDDSKEIYYQNALHRIRCKEGVFNYYILYLLWHYKLNGTIDYLCKGVTIKHFTQTVMNKLDILLPPFEEQKRIVTKIEELFAQLDKIESSLQA
ncbi:restriction endonuclease subunit S [Prevotella brevis]|uniref:Restriction endonuclease subunit S n=1 Tax=Xylanibacter brevis TaxID=83231 RepID=A0ABS9CHH3_9BACT|nr:restriction endonuclease subunit S [Xylanibacter brevis]MCF2564533.1 restriction endonuclease subunit S [Xylanibacter brevis]